MPPFLRALKIPLAIQRSSPQRPKYTLTVRTRRWIVAYVLRYARKSMRLGRHRQAARMLAFAARLGLTAPSLPLLRAKALYFTGRPVAARSLLAALRPRLLTTRSCAYRGARLQLNVGLVDDACRTATEACKRFPHSRLAWMVLGDIFVERLRLADALACYRTARRLAASPRVEIFTMYNIGRCLEYLGKQDDAIRVYDEILEIAPEETLAWFRLIDCQPGLNSDSSYVTACTDVLQRPRLRPSQRQHLHYSLARLYERSGRPGEAFAHFRLANECRASTSGVPSHALAQLRLDVDGRIKVFQQEMIARLARYGADDAGMIFVVGMPRSGTTLIDQILSSHSAVRSLGERQDIQEVTRMIREEVHAKRPYPWCAGKLSRRVIQQLAHRLAKQRRADAGDCDYILTKLPEDFWDLGLIAILFPRARIIHCTRHAIDTCLSCYMQNFQWVPYATNLEQLAEVYTLYRSIMEHWRAVVPAENMIEVSYERLIRCFPEQVNRLCQFCGLTFEEPCLRFYENRQTVSSASRWQVRRPLYTSAAYRWERYGEFLGSLLSLGE